MRSLSKIAKVSPLCMTSTVMAGNLTPSNEKWVHLSSLECSHCIVECLEGDLQVDTMQPHTLQVMSCQLPYKTSLLTVPLNARSTL